MEYVRIRSYLADGSGEFTGCEHLYLGNNQVKALDRFHREYPEHNSCIVVAETVDSEDNPEWFEACRRCGCVH